METQHIVLLIDSGGLFCVYGSNKDDRLMIPVFIYDFEGDYRTAIARYLSHAGLDWNDLFPIGPFGLGHPDSYFHVLQDGALGQAPHGYHLKWLTLEEIGIALNQGQFRLSKIVDRALSLYQKVYGSL